MSATLFEIIAGDFAADDDRCRDQGLSGIEIIGEDELKLLERGGRDGSGFNSGDASGLTGMGARGGGLEEFADEGESLCCKVGLANSCVVAGARGSMIDTPDGIESDRAGFG